MKHLFFFIICINLLLISPFSYAGNLNSQANRSETKVEKFFSLLKLNSKVKAASFLPVNIARDENVNESHSDNHTQAAPPLWLVIPFILLLSLIAAGPIFFGHFWHKKYPTIAVSLGLIVLAYYFGILHEFHHPVESLMEYFSFIALLSSLYIASGGILINVDKHATPMVNIGILAVGAILANFIGTTGASVLLIRPFMRVNQGRIQPYHIVFFIFIVSNVGGCLTPIGDPPLFIGFLKGIPFFWVIEHVWVIWLFGVSVLLTIFYVREKMNKTEVKSTVIRSGRISLKGYQNFLWIGLILISVFMDPSKFSWIPSITLVGKEFSFVRELIMFGVAYFSYKTTKPEILAENKFDFEPIREVAYLFFGIFCTMVPALAAVSHFANSPEGHQMINTNSLYWFTGILSAILDNAPTYLNFLTAAMAKSGLNISSIENVHSFVDTRTADLIAISISAVFFGAMTYIGNGPNFMVKSIAEQAGISMPSFFNYIAKYSIVYLLPVLILTWILFVL